MSFLTKEELFKIEYSIINNGSLSRARDLFIFSCYTGLSYIDLAKLNSRNICIGIDGEYWIKATRQKTETQINVPLLPKAFQLYKNIETTQKFLTTKKFYQ